MERCEIDLDLHDFVRRYLDPSAVGDACRACPRYAATWACPPFSFDVDKLLARFSRLRLFACTFPAGESGASFESLRTVRDTLNAEILALERTMGGLATYFGGSCTLCPECTRPAGQPCRHSARMRPSLEALGFDLCRALEDLFQIRLDWSPAPKTVTLTAALLHD